MDANFAGVSLAPSEAIEKLSRDSEVLAEGLYNLFLTREDMPTSSLTFNVLIAVGKTDIEKAHSRALLLSGRKEPILQKAGIRALGSFDYQTYGKENLLLLTLDRLKNLSRIKL